MTEWVGGELNDRMSHFFELQENLENAPFQFSYQSYTKWISFFFFFVDIVRT